MSNVLSPELFLMIDEILDSQYDKHIAYGTYSSRSSKTIPRSMEQNQPVPSKSDSGQRSRSPELTDAQRDKRTVFIRQLSQKITAPILQEFCERVGPVKQVKLVSDRVTHRFKGVAYVEFRSEESVPIAVSMTGQKLLGVPIIVEITETEKNRIAEEAAMAQKRNKELSLEYAHADPVSLYVSGVSYSVDEARLRAIFRQFGSVDSVQYIKDDAGFSKGNAVVRMSNSKEAAEAVEKLNGFILSNSPISVKMSKDTEVNTSKEMPFDCVALENMYNPELETEPNWQTELLNEVLEECMKFGTIVDSHIPLTKKGEIFIRFESENCANNALINLDGRWFSERKIVARRVNVDEFNASRSKNK